MARPSFLDRLPPEVQAELRKRLIDSNFTDYEGHTEWILALGHEASKSAVHRYGASVEAEIREQVDLRMRCLEVASKIAAGDELIATAEALLAWVNTGRSPPSR